MEVGIFQSNMYFFHDVPYCNLLGIHIHYELFSIIFMWSELCIINVEKADEWIEMVVVQQESL